MNLQIKKNYLGLLILFCSCNSNIENKEQKTIKELQTVDSVSYVANSSKINLTQKNKTLDSTSLEVHLKKHGMVEIKSLIPESIIDLKYSSIDNFVGVDLYGDLEKALCHPDMAMKLKKAYEFLQKEDSTLTLLIFDAVRPVSVQQKMWDTLKLPLREKTKFLSNPKNHSIHNYGLAVDISICTKSGVELDMGTPFDYIGVLAHPRQEKRLLKEGKLTQKQVNNRILLRKIMNKAGFFNIQTEWWHWNSTTRANAKKKYKLVQ